MPSWARQLLGPLVLFALWWGATTFGVIEADTLPGPGTVARTGADLTRSGELESAIAASLARVAVGLLIGIPIGLGLALLSGLFDAGESFIDAPMQILRALPVVALVPLAILWWGIGELPKVLLIAWATTFPVYINTVAAIRGVDRAYHELARSLELSRWTTVRRVVLPGALPGFLVGLRFSLTLAWIVLVVSEQINADSGLGHLTTQAREFFRTDVLIVALFVYGLLGFSTDLFVRFLERSLLTWRREYRPI